jgi:hypothetical protein
MEAKPARSRLASAELVPAAAAAIPPAANRPNWCGSPLPVAWEPEQSACRLAAPIPRRLFYLLRWMSPFAARIISALSRSRGIAANDDPVSTILLSETY